MKVHMITPSFILAELKADEEPSSEELEQTVNRLLSERGLTGWPSIEAEFFDCGGSALVFFSPVRVYIPSVLSRLLENH